MSDLSPWLEGGHTGCIGWKPVNSRHQECVRRIAPRGSWSRKQGSGKARVSLGDTDPGLPGPGQAAGGSPEGGPGKGGWVRRIQWQGHEPRPSFSQLQRSHTESGPWMTLHIGEKGHSTRQGKGEMGLWRQEAWSLDPAPS